MKRFDLQGIRGLAIVVVIGFHYYPTIIPNGYLGVDQFFVLSGYLMCMLLKRSVSSQLETCSLITTFYIRRFKRIIPLYYLIILLSIISLYTIFPKTAIRTNQESAIRALVFVSNRQQTQQEDYFKMLSLAIDIFTHTWSLSVEVQFYLIIPIIYIILRWINIKYEIISYSVIGLLSLIFHVLSPKSTAFNNMFARIWQFFIGMIVYQLSQKFKLIDQIREKTNEGYQRIDDNDKLEQQDDESDNDDMEDRQWKRWILSWITYFILINVIVCLFVPVELPSIVLRPLITCLTGILILISIHNQLLSNRVITYLGNISYVLYLVHWPIYAYCKLMNMDDCELSYHYHYHASYIDLIMFLSLSVVISMVIHHGYEKWYLKLKSTNIAILVIILLITNVILINNQQLFERKPDVIYNATSNASSNEQNVKKNGYIVHKYDPVLDTAEKLNNYWNAEDEHNMYSKKCGPNGGIFGDCHMTNLTPSNPYKLAVIGNSWASNIADVIYTECSNVFREILDDAEVTCEVLYPISWAGGCGKRLGTFYERVKKFKPDYLFIITRFVSTGNPLSGPSIDTDPTYVTMKSWLFKYLDIVNKDIYILNAIPAIDRTSIAKIALKLKAGMSIENVDKSIMKIESGSENARKKNDKLIKDCGGRCHLIDYKQDFYDEELKRWRFFDQSNGYSWLTHGEHLTPHGWEKVRHHYTDICRRIDNK